MKLPHSAYEILISIQIEKQTKKNLFVLHNFFTVQAWNKE